ALRLDDRPGPGRRADVEIGDLVVALRDLGQHRRVVAERGLDIPARKIAVDRELAVAWTQRVEQQEHADRLSLVVQHVAEAGIALGHVARRLTLEALHPVVARANDEAARHEIGDGVEVRLADFAASDLWPERSHGLGSRPGLLCFTANLRCGCQLWR